MGFLGIGSKTAAPSPCQLNDKPLVMMSPQELAGALVAAGFDTILSGGKVLVRFGTQEPDVRWRISISADGTGTPGIDVMKEKKALLGGWKDTGNPYDTAGGLVMSGATLSEQLRNTLTSLIPFCMSAKASQDPGPVDSSFESSSIPDGGSSQLEVQRQIAQDTQAYANLASGGERAAFQEGINAFQAGASIVDR